MEMLFDGVHGRKTLTEAQQKCVSSVCSKCVGHCCMSFRMAFPTTDKGAGLVVDWDKAARMRKDNEDEAYATAFCRDNFDIVELESEGYGANVTFRCRQHNRETGKCMAYDRRPHFCRLYGCGSLYHAGKPPDGKEFMMQSQAEGGPQHGVFLDVEEDPLWRDAFGKQIEEEKAAREAAMKELGGALGGGASSDEVAVAAEKLILAMEDLNVPDERAEEVVAPALA